MNAETMTPALRLKLLAWFAVHAPEVPRWIDLSLRDFVAGYHGSDPNGDQTRPIMSREAWCAEWARRQLAEFEKMWETLETP